MELLIPIILIALGYGIGGWRERSHFRSLNEREAQYRHLLVNNLRHVTDNQNVRHAQMVTAQVVIASDYFKMIAMSIRNLFGGEAKAAMRMMERARREALLRVLEQAERLGADEVWNVRFQTSNINQMKGKRGALQVELFAYATAISRGQPRQISTDVTCEQCGYNLRGILGSEMCPECGNITEVE